MLKKIILFSFCTIFAFGSMEKFAHENNYYTSYQEALALSKQTGKPIFMLIVTTTCPWCEKLKKQTLIKEEIHTAISKHYIPLILNRDKALYPINRFEAKVVPTVFIVDGITQEILNASYGYKSKEKFLEFLHNK